MPLVDDVPPDPPYGLRRHLRRKDIARVGLPVVR